jgi:ribosomal protein S18 acetylase RimI-like enzyme
MKIRPATAADLAAVGRVHARSRGEAYKDLVPADALHAVDGAALGRWWEQRWEYERTTHRLSVARDAAGAVLGFTYVGPSGRPGTGELYAIHVDPDRQGSGVGRALMGRALADLAGLGVGRAVLWVLRGNAPARRFYERGGWHRDGSRRRAPVGTALADQVRYSKRLGGST